MKKNKTEILFFLIGCALSVLMLKTLKLHTDNTQLMDKAMRLLFDGEWTHFGNMATKVGNIPGSFLTGLTSFPMAVYLSAWSACFSVIMFHILSYYFLRKSLFHIVQDQTQQIFTGSLFLAVFFWLNPWRVEQAELYNPGFVFLFASVHLWTSLNMTSKNFWITFFHVLNVGFCFQVHFSFLILALISFFLFIRGQIAVSWKGFFAGALVVAASLIPFVLAKFFSNDVLQNQQLQALDFSKSDAYFGRNFVLVYPVFKAVMYFFRMGSAYFGRHIFTEINFDWVDHPSIAQILNSGFHGLKYVIALGSMVISFYFIGRFLKENFQKRAWMQTTMMMEPKNRFYIYFFWLFISVVVAAGLSPVEFNHWHLVIVFPMISLFLVLQLLHFPRVVRHQNKIVIVFAVVFVTWGFLAAVGSRSHQLSLNYQDQFLDHYREKYPTLDQRLGGSILFEK